MWNYSMLPSDLDILPKYSKYAIMNGFFSLVLAIIFLVSWTSVAAET